MDINNIIILLRDKYNSFINEDTDYNFFVGLADYVEFIQSNKDIRTLLDKFKKIRKSILAKEELLRKKSINELNYIIFKIKNIIKKEENLIKNDLLYLELDKINFCLEEDLTPIYLKIKKAFNFLKNNKEICLKHSFLKNDFSFLTKNFYKYKLEILNIRDKNKNELWFCYERISLINIAIFHMDDYFKKTKECSLEFLRLLNISTGIMIIEKILNLPDFNIEKNFFIETRSRFELYASRIHNYLIEELNKKQNKKEKEGKSKHIILYLNKNGDLYREPKNKYCYQMKNKSNLFKILNFFASNQIYNYRPTESIMSELEFDNKANFMKDIGKINRRVRYVLNFKEKIIEGRKGSGYKINSKYKIKLI